MTNDIGNKGKTLVEIVSFCQWCPKDEDRKIRFPDETAWRSITSLTGGYRERYHAAQINYRLSHGMCPDCGKKYLEMIESEDLRSD